MEKSRAPAGTCQPQTGVAACERRAERSRRGLRRELVPASAAALRSRRGGDFAGAVFPAPHPRYPKRKEADADAEAHELEHNDLRNVGVHVEGDQRHVAHAARHGAQQRRDGVERGEMIEHEAENDVEREESRDDDGGGQADIFQRHNVLHAHGAADKGPCRNLRDELRGKRHLRHAGRQRQSDSAADRPDQHPAWDLQLKKYKSDGKADAESQQHILHKTIPRPVFFINKSGAAPGSAVSLL